jgi:vacuolar-type H+-ATPase subunit E/Vma4
MSLEAILSKIEKDAEQRAGAILEKAEDERRKALEEHETRLKEEFGREAEKIRSRVDESLKKKGFHVRRAAARKLMNARRSMMDRAVDQAVENISAYGDEKYLALISALLRGCDLKGEVQVIISPADEHRITAEFLGEHSGKDRMFALSRERHGEKGGVILRSGDISQNGTFPLIAELAHEELVMELSGLIPLEKV